MSDGTAEKVADGIGIAAAGRSNCCSKSWKSHKLVEGARDTTKKAIAEGLIWAIVLLALLVKRRLALTLIGSAELSMLKIAKNSAFWLMPILASIIHGGMAENNREVGVGNGVFIHKNGKRVVAEKKSKQNNTLDLVLLIRLPLKVLYIRVVTIQRS